MQSFRIAGKMKKLCSQTSRTLRDAIAKTSGIRKEYLQGKSIYSASISMRMSWAAERQATSSEDIAYSLLGIFDVNMPLLYGEGKSKAFRRLQEEIMKISEDETLFAWEGSEFEMDSSSADVLASDPKDFSEAKHLLPYSSDEPVVPYSMTHRGLRICLQRFRLSELQGDIEDIRRSIRPLRSPVMIWADNNDLVWASLKCHVAHDYHHAVVIPLRHDSANTYVRNTSTSVALMPNIFSSSSIPEKEIYIRNSRVMSSADSVQRRFGFLLRRLPDDVHIAVTSYPSEAWKPKDKILQSNSSARGERFWHASITLILPARSSSSTLQHAVCLSLGCENDPALKMPKAWCYLDDVLRLPQSVDLRTFHEESASRVPRYEINSVGDSTLYPGLKVSIRSDKVLGQRMFVVDIEHVQGDSKLVVPEKTTQGIAGGSNAESAAQTYQIAPSVDVGYVSIHVTSITVGTVRV